MCSYTGAVGTSYEDMLTAESSTHKPEQKDICGAQPSAACKERYNMLNELYGQAKTQYKNAVSTARKGVNSIIFNVFIFCSVMLFLLFMLLIKCMPLMPLRS